MTIEDYASAENAHHYSLMKKFLDEASQTDNDNKTEDDEELVASSKSDVENSFEILKNFCLFNEKGSDHIPDLMN